MARSEASGCQIAHASSAAVTSAASAATILRASGRHLMGRSSAAGVARSPPSPRGPSPARYPAGMSAMTAGSWMNHVQSRSDWMPNTSGTSASVTRAMRSVSQSRRGGGVASPPPRRSGRGTRPVALSAAITQARKSSVVTARPDEPQVGHRLRDPSVRVLGHGRVGAMPEPRLLERSRADPLERAVVEHSERLAPVLAARRRRGEHAAAALPGRHLRFTGELVDAVTDAALAEGHRREGRERHEARDA